MCCILIYYVLSTSSYNESLTYFFFSGGNFFNWLSHMWWIIWTLPGKTPNVSCHHLLFCCNQFIDLWWWWSCFASIPLWTIRRRLANLIGDEFVVFKVKTPWFNPGMSNHWPNPETLYIKLLIGRKMWPSCAEGSKKNPQKKRGQGYFSIHFYAQLEHFCLSRILCLHMTLWNS